MELQLVKTKQKTIDQQILEQSLINKNRLEEIRMFVNWADNCCWC